MSARGVVRFPPRGHASPGRRLVESPAAQPPCPRRPTQAVRGQSQCGRARGAKVQIPLSPLGQGVRTSKPRLSHRHPLVGCQRD